MDPIQEIDTTLPTDWTTAQSRAQFAALAKLRWCIFRNSFRRKGGTGELVARIILLPILGIAAFGPIIGCGFGAYVLTSGGRLTLLPILTWAIFVIWQVVVLNIAAPGLSFDINTIIRFPLSFPRYLTARVFFGLLSASTIIGTLCLIAADIGIGIAKPSLVPWATLLFATYALSNIFFTRMILVWVERWLSTRRARELLTAFILFASLGFQYININYNPGFQHGRHHANHIPLLLKILHRIQPIAALLPPGLTASSIVGHTQSHNLAAFASLLGLIAFTVLFFSVYAWRMHREFLGENLSETTQPNRPSARRSPAHHRSTNRPRRCPSPPPRAHTFGLNPTIIACLQKDFIYLRRNLNQLYGFVVPLFMVFLVANRMSASGRYGSYVFPAAVAYSVLGVSVLSYNGLGMDGSGVQFYFLSPTRLRDVFLAKNLTVFFLSFLELVLIFAVIAFVAHPPTLIVGLATVCWLVFATFINGAVGNLRSLIAPKKIDLSKVSRKQASQLSVLIALGILLACLVIGAAVAFVANSIGRPWLMIPILLALAVGSFIFYVQVLNRLDAIALTHRETLSEELCKA